MEEGGETVFPVADMKDFNETVSAACHDSLLTSANVQYLLYSYLHTHARTRTQKKKNERRGGM